MGLKGRFGSSFHVASSGVISRLSRVPSYIRHLVSLSHHALFSGALIISSCSILFTSGGVVHFSSEEWLPGPCPAGSLTHAYICLTRCASAGKEGECCGTRLLVAPRTHVLLSLWATQLSDVSLLCPLAGAL